MDSVFRFFAGIDWGSDKHRVCLMNRDGQILAERWIEHNGDSLAELAVWLRQQTSDSPWLLAAAIEIPRGAVVETLLEHGFIVFSINPMLLDRFRDRYSPAGAKDDRRDAFVLADALRTDIHCFRSVRLDDPFHRFFPQLLQLCACADEPWLWALFELAPSPLGAARLTEARIARLLQQHRIRRITAAEVRSVLKTKPLTLAPGAAEAAAEHALLLLPRLRLLHRQRTDLARRIGALLDELATPAEGQQQHRDAAILLSLPGLGRKVAATMLSEASQAIADRDYHALRCYSGTAPITHQSGKKKVVLMRRGVNERLRNALYHWARVSVVFDPQSKKRYAAMRASGHSHGRALRGMADRWLKVLTSMLTTGTLYSPQHNTA